MYDVKTARDIHEALKDLLGGTIQEMLEAELDEHLGYEKNALTEETKLTIEMVISQSILKQLVVSWKYRFLRIEMPSLSLTLCPNIKEIYQKLS